MRRCHVSLLRLVLGHGCCLASVASGSPTCCWPLATEMQMLVAARHRWPGTSQARGRGSRYRQICLIGAQWCTVVPYAGQGRTAG